MAYNAPSSSFLPTVKCSMCAKDIEISQMGEHVCGGPEAILDVPPVPVMPGAQANGHATPPPDTYRGFDQASYEQEATNGTGYHLKPGRAPPPRVDVRAANRPWLQHEELTPVSASPSPNPSPMKSNDGGHNASLRPKQSSRSASQSLPRGPPSPEPLSSNLDSAFPQFSNPKLAPPRNQLGAGLRNFSESDNLYAPVSPRTASAGGLLQRLETIAPGPFDGHMNGHRRNVTGGGSADLTMSTRTSASGGSIARPSTAGPRGHSRSSSNSSKGSRSGIIAPRVPRNNGYGGFGPPSGDDGHREPLSPENRSHTFPLQNGSHDEHFRGTTDPWPRQPSNDEGVFPKTRRMPSMSGPDLTRAPPPRGVSLIKPRLDTKLGDAPSVNLAVEFGIGNPYHTPTESSSSDVSASSDHSKASSRSSPPRSIRRRPSDTSKLDGLMSDLSGSLPDVEPKSMPTSISSSHPEGELRASPAKKKSPPGNLSPVMLMDLAIQQGKASRSPTTPNHRRPTSPYGYRQGQPTLGRPSTGNGLPPLSPLSPGYRGPSSPFEVRSGQPTLQPPPTGNRDASLSANSPAYSAQRRPPSPVHSRSSESRRLRPQEPPVQRPHTADSNKRHSPPNNRTSASKGNCKGCSLPIKGKSVSSADGRLTGRYHKECFVCSTCAEPFQTATFYVIHDSPYCERHYHKLNGSVCQACDRGIEGPYLESERREKFHPKCFTCADCNRELQHDYFEVNGRVYCERDALRRTTTQQGRFLGPGGGGLGGAGTSKMDRRTTRLMMMV